MGLTLCFYIFQNPSTVRRHPSGGRIATSCCPRLKKCTRHTKRVSRKGWSTAVGWGGGFGGGKRSGPEPRDGHVGKRLCGGRWRDLHAKKYAQARVRTHTVWRHVMRTTNYCSCHGLFICRWSFYSRGTRPNHERRKLLICVHVYVYNIYMCVNEYLYIYIYI